MSLFVFGVKAGDQGGAFLAASVRDELEELSIRAQSAPDCLAWSGLRRLAIVERRLRATASKDYEDQTLVGFFESWRRPDSVTASVLTPLETQAILDCRYPKGLRTPLDYMAQFG
ncbi:MAG: hypothetical protein LBK42_13210 [Propionibacteriaceae bacterium]|jgi:hypothetical protein|nr:hypothetical protein [Propionibacteriaceae bacterium]